MSDPYGSPLSKVPLIHMARFAIIDDLPYQGVPNNRDDLLSDYMLFVCDFDGMNVDTLVAAMIDDNRQRGGGSDLGRTALLILVLGAKMLSPPISNDANYGPTFSWLIALTMR